MSSIRKTRWLTACPGRPVRTFDTACTYFHKFRLNFRDAEYNYQDAALASLFVACKVEDTIKKSRDILAAAYCVKNPEKTASPDDKVLTLPLFICTVYIPPLFLSSFPLWKPCAGTIICAHLASPSLGSPASLSSLILDVVVDSCVRCLTPPAKSSLGLNA